MSYPFFGHDRPSWWREQQIEQYTQLRFGLERGLGRQIMNTSPKPNADPVEPVTPANCFPMEWLTECCGAYITASTEPEFMFLCRTHKCGEEPEQYRSRTWKQCAGITVAKKYCQRGAKKNGYCDMHQSQAEVLVLPAKKEEKVMTKLCTAKTKAGNPCGNQPKHGEVLCGPHLDQAEAEQAKYETKEAIVTETEKVVNDNEYTVVITGHRPNKLGGYNENNPIQKWVSEALGMIFDRIIEKKGGFALRDGLAQGVDWLAATQAIIKKQPVDGFVPCVGQESKWPAATQKRYHKLRGLLRNEYLIHDGPYNNDCMQDRNEAMIDGRRAAGKIASLKKADVLIAVWNGTNGGTANMVWYARYQGVDILFVNPQTYKMYWELESERMQRTLEQEPSVLDVKTGEWVHPTGISSAAFHHALKDIDQSNAQTECDGCHGSGVYYGHGHVENGKFVGVSGKCYRCGGKGHQVGKDRVRNTVYDAFYHRFEA